MLTVFAASEVLPSSDGAGYVAAAYLFFLLMVLVYIAIIGIKFQRVNRDLGELIDDLETRTGSEATGSPPAEPPQAREESSV
jgi:hypothetical protein